MSMKSEDNSLPSSFAWLNFTQFLGALNDNLFKLLLIFLLVDVQGAQSRAAVLSLAATVFVVPFLLFSHSAGVLADRYSKRSIIVTAKAVEIVLTLLGCGAVLLKSPLAMYTVLFLLCTQGAFFGPSKYGIIPELVGEARLSRANGILVGFTYLAIILGTFIPSFMLLKVFNHNYLLMAFFCVGVAVVGFFTSLRIEKTPAQKGSSHFSLVFPLEQFRTLRGLGKDRDLLLAVLGSAYFLYLGSFVQQALMLYGSDEHGLHMGWIESGYLFPVAALGIGLGGVLAGRMSGRNIEFGIVPLGALILTGCCLGLWAAPARLSADLPLISLFGLGAGLFIVPLDSFVQYRSPPERRGEILACSNALSFLGVALSAGTFVVCTSILRLSASQCFFVAGVMTAGLAVLAIVALPDFFVRFIILLITRLLYRIRVTGLDNLPISGGALLVANHVTWVDALLISAVTQRRVRFLMAREIYNQPWIRPLFKLMGIIPIGRNDPPRQIIEALNAARRQMEEGFLVCIFAEGALTRNGNLLEFKGGVEHILKGTQFPVIPVCIGGAWGSIFSYYEGRFPGHHPRHLPYPIALLIGAPMPSTSTSYDIRQAVQELSSDTAQLLATKHTTLAHRFVTSARIHWFRKALTDTTGKDLSYGQTLTAAVYLAEELDRVAPGQDRIGVLLPASVGGALVNAAATLTGRTVVNLNFTVAQKALDTAIQRSELQTVVTSRQFLKKLEYLAVPVACVYVEDLLEGFTSGRKVRALLKAALLPARLLMTHRRVTRDDIATIIFSSGSTGDPKGVMLSHMNIVSNMDAFRDVFKFNVSDRMTCVLPFFHSFGYTCTLWCPLLTGFHALYHPNPLEATAIAELIRKHQASVLLATPTFLLTYMRKASREDFASLRIIVTGAEKLKPRLADAYEERYGIRPLEGYGATELSPVVAVNVPDVTLGGVHQVGSKVGSIGHPIPGVAVRVVDPETLQPFPQGREGLLLVKGPNVMKGYLGQPERTAEVIRDGWYSTGDVAHVDSSGFVFLVDRLSRFSKIGGEMVPHVAVEEKLHEALHAMNQVVFVTSVEDERKGEQLVVLYTSEAGDPDKLQQALRELDLPNLWKPRKDSFFAVQAFPTLGSGKMDISRLREIARERAAQQVREGSAIQ
jgi:acyl-[acyl-carrier-protein]-phospholipid O-acyltransferase / long-chain-fatty-acid--[acyl-carrier-protein] ligase